MMVSNHFDVRWVDGYSAVSDVPSSLAAVIEKVAAELPSSHDRIEVAVRDVRRSDGSIVRVGLLRFVVAVSSAPRPLGYLHAAVLPGGYALDLSGWRALVARRYGAHPEERIRALYEELAESTRDSGRARLHALAIRPEDVRELLKPLDDAELASSAGRSSRPAISRAPSKPNLARPVQPGTGPLPKLRPSSPMLPMPAGLHGGAPSEAQPPASVGSVPEDDPDLPTDITQPMEAPPPGTAAPLSGEHPQQVRPAEHPVRRAWWGTGATLGAVALLLGAVGWLAYRQQALIDERDQLLQRHPDQAAWARERAQLKEALEKEQNRTADMCKKHVEEAERCARTLQGTREQARSDIDAADRKTDEVRLQLADANNRLAAAVKAREDAELAHRGEHQRAVSAREQLEALVGQLRRELDQRDERLKVLCKDLQSARKHPKECQGT